MKMTDDSVDLDAGLSEQDAVTLVWDAAEGLSPKNRMVLDLNLRHGLAGQELADSLDVTRQNAYVLLDKMKKALSRATGALLVARYKRRDCEELNAATCRLGWPLRRARTKAGSGAISTPARSVTETGPP